MPGVGARALDGVRVCVCVCSGGIGLGRRSEHIPVSALPRWQVLGHGEDLPRRRRLRSTKGMPSPAAQEEVAPGAAVRAKE